LERGYKQDKIGWKGALKALPKNGKLFPWAFFLSLIRNIEKKDTLTKRGGGARVQIVTTIEAQE
jgi:hypothetical protein